MIARLLLSLFFCVLNFTIARAAISCDTLLAAASSSSAGSASTANVFVNLVQLYAQQASAQQSEEIFNKVLSSDEFINPFASSKDRASIQFSAAIEKIRPQISKSDWQQIKASLAELANKNKGENQDRDEKEEERSYILNPKVLPKIRKGERFGAAPAWRVVDGRLLLATGNYGGLALHEMVGGKFEKLDSRAIKHSEDEAPVWHEIDGQHYIASAGSESLIHVHKVTKNTLEKATSKHLEQSGTLFAPSWHTINGQTFIMFGSSTGTIYIYEFVKNKTLKLISSISIGDLLLAAPSLQVVDGRHFVSVGTLKGAFYVYELKEDQLVEIFKQELKTISTSPVWQLVGDRAFVSVLTNEHLHLFELVNGKIEQRDSKYIGFGFATPSWKIVNNRAYILFGSSVDLNILLFEVVGGNLIERQSQDAKGAIYSAFSWQTVGDRLFAASSTTGLHFELYEMVEGELVHVLSVPLGEENVQTAVSWQAFGDKIYVAFGVSLDGVIVIKLFDKLKKQGGRK